MPAVLAKTNSFEVKVDYPSSWQFMSHPVTSLLVPIQLFAVSNRPIRPTPDGSPQPRPMIEPLDAGGMFIWAYYQTPRDPRTRNTGALPDYSRFVLPLRYDQSAVMGSYDAREWDPSKFLWRRLGFQTAETTVTVWIWEGTRAQVEDIATAEAIVASIGPAT